MKAILSLATVASLALSVGQVAQAQNYTQVNLVANVSGVAPVTDPHLVNPWGLSRNSGSPWWVSDNGTGLSTLYNGPGAINPLVVTIPKANPNSKTFPTGTPTGTIANTSPTDFLLAAGKPADFLFATLDGTIQGWNPGVKPTTAVIVAKTTDGSSYTGLTSALINGKRFLYAANFPKGTVDVYDNAFHKVTVQPNADGDHDRDDRGDNNREAFIDERLPRNFTPFNVQAIGNDIVVTFALHQEGTPLPIDGPGLGYVDIFSSDGRLLQRLENGNWLNAPWGVALAPLDFGAFSHDLLIGQFASAGTTENSGTIAAYDLATGKFLGQVQDATGKPLAINGLWDISPGNSAAAASADYDPAGAPGGELYFSAGPDHGQGGLFGYLKPVATELTVGNDQ
ncbi:MAG TPA: TIGR03118 family protein [Rhodopila sp.]